MKELSRAHGYYAITGKQGLNSFLAGLHHDQAHLLVGLDGSKNHIRRHIETTSCCRQKLRAYFTPATQSVPVTKLQSLEVRERFGAKSTCDFIELQEMPILPDGSVNRNALFALEGINAQQPQVPVQAQTEVEKTLASIWQELLHIDAADIHSNFFDLGGNSLLLAQLSRKLQSTFKKEVSLVELFQYSTISLLSQFLGKVSKEGVISQSHPSQIRGQSRREKVLNMKSKKISIRSEKMCKP
ncbi:MAG: phosphopantetheine-binding protein [Cyanobacteriota bacterium]